MQTTINRERSDDFAYELPDISEDGAYFTVRVIPVTEPGVEGEVYIFARIDSEGESWAARRWAVYRYPELHPNAAPPPFPGDLQCLHGIDFGWLGSYGPDSGFVARLDYRRAIDNPTLSRVGRRRPHPHYRRTDVEPVVAGVLEQALREHSASTPKASGDNAWHYKQRLIEAFKRPSYWRSVPETIRLYRSAEALLASLDEVQQIPIITSTMSRTALGGLPTLAEAPRWTQPSMEPQCPSLVLSDLEDLSSEHRKEIFRMRRPANVRWLKDGNLAIDWSLSDDTSMPFDEYLERPLHIVELPSASTAGTAVHKTVDTIYAHGLLNASHPFVRWLMAAKDASERSIAGLTREQFSRVLSLAESPIWFHGLHIDRLINYLNQWKSIPDLPPELVPPTDDSKRWFGFP